MELLAHLEQLIATDDYPALLATCIGWDDKQKRTAWKWLGANWRYTGGIVDDRVMVACAACAKTPKEALQLAPPIEYLMLEVHRFVIPTKLALIQALASHGRAWVIDYLDLVATGKTRKQHDMDVLLALLDGFGTPLPQSDAFRQYWCAGFNLMSRDFFRYPSTGIHAEPYQYEVPRLILDNPAQPGSLRVEARQTHTPVQTLSMQGSLRSGLALNLARRDGILDMVSCLYHIALEPAQLDEIITGLLENGALERTVLIEDLLHALTRNDSVSAQRLQVRWLELTRLSDTEIAHYGAILQSLLASSHGCSAELAQKLLRQLDQQQAMSADWWLTAAQMVFARKEKGLRNAQLAWLAARLGQYPEQMASHLMALIAVLAVDDFKMQDKAVRLLLQYWPKADSSQQNEELTQALLACLPTLDEGLAAKLSPLTEAGHAQGSNNAAPTTPTHLSAMANLPTLAVNPAPSAMPNETLPLRPFVTLPADEPNLRELLARHASSASVLVCEQIIDVVLRLATQNRPALIAALQPYTGTPLNHCYGWHALPQLLACAVMPEFPLALLRKFSVRLLQVHTRQSADPFPPSVNDTRYKLMPPTAALAQLRLDEIVTAIHLQRSYALLAKPDFDNGSILPDTLYTRLAQLAQGNQEAEPLDLLQALLRTRQPEPAQIDAMRAIGSAQARVASDFFAAGGLSPLQTIWLTVPGNAEDHWNHCHDALRKENQPEVCVALSSLPLLPDLPAIPTSWAHGFTPKNALRVNEFHLDAPSLTGVLPNHGEILAAFDLLGFRKAGADFNSTGGKAAAQALPLYLAARGPAGAALHLAILFSLSANDAAARLAASDGMVELIAQQRYQSQLAAELVSATIECGSVKVARLAKSLVPVLDAGLAAALWPLLRAALCTSLAQENPPPGTPDLLALANRAAKEGEQREHIELLAQTAARNGNSKLVVEARRLHLLLSGGAR